MRAISPAGPAAASGSAGPGRSSARPPARWATGCRRPSPRRSSIAIGRSSRSSATAGSAMTMAELETAVRVGARVVVVVFDNERYGTIRMWQERRGTGVGRRDASSARSISRRSPGPAGRAGVRVERDADFEPALRAALVADRATVIQVALDRAWVSIDQTTGLMRATFHLVPTRSGRRRIPAVAVRGGVARRRRVHPLHGRRRGPRRDVRPATTRRIRGRSWP